MFISIKIFSCYLLKWQFKEIRQADPTKIYKQWQNCLSKYGDIGANCLIGCCCLANQTRDETLLPPLATCGYVFLIHYFLLKSVLKWLLLLFSTASCRWHRGFALLRFACLRPSPSTRPSTRPTTRSPRSFAGADCRPATSSTGGSTTSSSGSSTSGPGRSSTPSPSGSTATGAAASCPSGRRRRRRPATSAAEGSAGSAKEGPAGGTASGRSEGSTGGGPKGGGRGCCQTGWAQAAGGSQKTGGTEAPTGAGQTEGGGSGGGRS